MHRSILKRGYPESIPSLTGLVSRRDATFRKRVNIGTGVHLETAEAGMPALVDDIVLARLCCRHLVDAINAAACITIGAEAMAPLVRVLRWRLPSVR